MSGPKHFELRITMTAAERLRLREQARIDEMRRSTGAVLERLKSLTRSVADAEQARRPVLTSQVAEMADLIQQASAATLSSFVAPSAAPVPHPAASTLRQALDTHASVSSVAQRLTQDVQREAELNIERVSALERRRGIASEIAAALSEMGFQVRTEERRPSPSSAAAPMVVAARGEEQVLLSVNQDGLSTDWKERPGAPCDPAVRDLSARLRERGIDMTRTDDGGNGASVGRDAGGSIGA